MAEHTGGSSYITPAPTRENGRNQENQPDKRTGRGWDEHRGHFLKTKDLSGASYKPFQS